MSIETLGEILPQPAAELSETMPEPLPALPLESDELPRPINPDALSALNAGAAVLEVEENAACAAVEDAAEIAAQEHVSAQLDALGAKLAALDPDALARLVARVGASLGDAHAAVKLVGALRAR